MELDVRFAEQVGAGADPTHAQFGLLVESVSDYAIFLLDPAGRVTSWNAGAERIKGYSAAEIIGRHFSLFFPVEDRSGDGKDDPLARLSAREREVLQLLAEDRTGAEIAQRLSLSQKTRPIARG
jgi:PAS domain S-box-containing protein